MLILPNPLSLPALVFSLYLSLYFSSCSPGTGTVRHYWSNTVVLGKGGGIKCTLCKPISEAESRKSECKQKLQRFWHAHRHNTSKPKHVCACWREPETLHKCHHPLQFDIQASEAKNSTLRSFCASCDSSDSHQELSICFGLISAPS